VPNGISLVIEFIVRGTPITVTIWVTTGNPITQAYLELLGAAVQLWWETVADTAYFNDVFYSKVTVTDQSMANSIQAIIAPPAPIPGALPGESEPNSVAVVVSLRTNKIGRSFRGRLFTPPPGVGVVSGSNITAGHQAALKDVWDDLLATLVTAGSTPVVVSKYANKLPRVVAVATPIFSTVVNSRVDTQRRRLPKT
jgi:hypothetical protein